MWNKAVDATSSICYSTVLEVRKNENTLIEVAAIQNNYLINFCAYGDHISCPFQKVHNLLETLVKAKVEVAHFAHT